MSRPYNATARRFPQPPGNIAGQRPPTRYQQKPNPFYRNPNNNYSSGSYQSPHRELSSRPPTTRLPSNFVISLLPDGTDPNSHKIPDITSLISECAAPSCRRSVFSTGSVAASIHFSAWDQARSCMAKLWERRLNGDHCLTPDLRSHVMVPSDSEELRRELGAVFADHVKSLVAGEEVGKLKLEVESKRGEIDEVSRQLKAKKGVRFDLYTELSNKKDALVAELEVTEKRLDEFMAAMRCILKYIGGGKLEEPAAETKGVDVEPFLLQGEVDWVKIHRLILREIRRLQDGLPIYAHRREILARIRDSQIMVLIGETGSGKSTQLVQFLADAGIGSSETVICTQPRKIATISIADRVKGECHGCYKDSNSIIAYPTFSSDQPFGSKVIYATDHCLLQHFMNDRNLPGISCIVIDEAHERSSNTDLLLALIKCLLLDQTRDLRLVIMSATADANQLSDYFFGCDVFHVSGRSFPVDLKYISSDSEASTSAWGPIAPYVQEVVKTSKEIHRSEKEGTILAFLTSQQEVEWACENFQAPLAVAFPLHGKLSFEDQFRIFQDFPGKRKVIFATNLAETSLTIPGLKYVVDSGMVKESRFEPGRGMSMLKVLRILALGIKNISEFDFIDAPSHQAIDMAIRNLVQLGAIRQSRGSYYELTDEGRYFVKLGIEPRLGKLVLYCFRHRLGKEGLALAAVMANASSIFCRVGTKDDKIKADCLKVQFCHSSGDLFTMLSVFKEWEALPRDHRSKWCWDNSINAKSMRRCQEAVKEMEESLRRELDIIVPSLWLWSPHKSAGHDKHLKWAIVSALVENVAMYSGYDQLGYQVAMTGQTVRLHPSCSLQMFAEKPSWVVFGELLSTVHDYLVCVTAFDFESLPSLDPPPLFDFHNMDCQKLRSKKMTGFGTLLL
ncbi:unnamed protein product [Linum trigynum]|uniref:RNA helicase n=1 Tax=Linum trigynum TaxID=586398 RepID=A0AAV2FQ74_9ROSI